MAANSLRERILVQLVSTVSDVEAISTVRRTKQSYAKLKEFAVTQFPVVAIVGRLPQPLEHIKGRAPGGADLFVSDLQVDFFVYGMANEDEDTLVSNLADDLWAVLHADQTVNNLAISTSLVFTEDPQYWPPFVAFKLTATIKYKHLIGGI
ncbi:MAG: hypothetical protein DRJ03_01330 [Chloroflexi bacterium]|nr:MAG: hypothetical protein DRJ03_01330 [Chloroflexota bacterium]